MNTVEHPPELMRLVDIMREKGLTRTDAERVMRRAHERYKLGKFVYVRRADVERVIDESRMPAS